MRDLTVTSYMYSQQPAWALLIMIFLEIFHPWGWFYGIYFNSLDISWTFTDCFMVNHIWPWWHNVYVGYIHWHSCLLMSSQRSQDLFDWWVTPSMGLNIFIFISHGALSQCRIWNEHWHRVDWNEQVGMMMVLCRACGGGRPYTHELHNTIYHSLKENQMSIDK